MTHLTPEAQARLDIDRQLTAAGWTVQSRDQMNIFRHQVQLLPTRKRCPTSSLSPS